MHNDQQLYGRVILSDRVRAAALKSWERKDDEMRASYVRTFPATAVSIGIDPRPYLDGSDVDLGAVMEYVAKESMRRSEE
jgi:hypothetical protein